MNLSGRDLIWATTFPCLISSSRAMLQRSHDWRFISVGSGVTQSGADAEAAAPAFVRYRREGASQPAIGQRVMRKHNNECGRAHSKGNASATLASQALASGSIEPVSHPVRNALCATTATGGRLSWRTLGRSRSLDVRHSDRTQWRLEPAGVGGALVNLLGLCRPQLPHCVPNPGGAEEVALTMVWLGHPARDGVCCRLRGRFFPVRAVQGAIGIYAPDNSCRIAGTRAQMGLRPVRRTRHRHMARRTPGDALARRYSRALLRDEPVAMPRQAYRRTAWGQGSLSRSSAPHQRPTGPDPGYPSGRSLSLCDRDHRWPRRDGCVHAREGRAGLRGNCAGESLPAIRR